MHFLGNADKYLQACCMREKLSNCIQIKAEEKIRKVATEQNDATVIANSI